MPKLGRNRDAAAAAAADTEQRQQLERKEDNRSTVEVLSQARRDANSAISTGEATSVQLAAQGEQMDRVGRKLDNIEADLTASDKVLKTMTSWTGFFTGIFGGNKPVESKKKPVDVPPPAPAKPAGGAAQPVGKSGGGATGAPKPKGKGASAAAAESSPTYSPYTKEEDELLDGLCDDVAKLKGIAQLHNATLKEHDGKLDTLTDKTARAKGHTERTNGKVKSMLR